MQNFSVQAAKIVGTPSQKTWSQVHTFFPEDFKKKEKRGILLAVLSFAGIEEGIEALSAGREILSRLHEEYYGQIEIPVLEQLKRAVNRVCQEFTGEEQKLEICAGVLLGDVLYLVISGGGQVWLKRQGVLGRALEGNGEVIDGSGLLEEGDILVLGTSSFFRALGQGVLRAALESGEPAEAVEALATLVHGQQSSSQAAALIGKIHEESSEMSNASPTVLESQTGIKSLFSGIVARIPRYRVRPALPARFAEALARRAGRPQVRSQKTILTIAIILIILLVLSIILGARKRQQEDAYQRFTKIYEEVRSLAEQGEGLVGINPSQARQMLASAQQKISQLEELKIESHKTDELKKRIETALGGVVKEYQLSEVPTLTDLTLVGQGGRGDILSLSGKYLVILDKSQSRVFGFDIARKSGEILAGGEVLSNSQFLTSTADFVFVLAKEGLTQIGIKNKKIEGGKIETDKEWGEITAMKAYGGNLYFLDREKNIIWRYSTTEEGFGTKQNWFARGVSPDLSSVVSMSIDGVIWFLTQDGKILKFIQGAPVAFGVAGLDKPFLNPSIIYTDSEAGNLYILDKGNNRIVVLAKSGEYQSQYLWDGVSGVSDMVVSEAEKKILLLSGSKIYQIDLKS